MTTPAPVGAPRGPRAAIAAALRRPAKTWLVLALVVLLVVLLSAHAIGPDDAVEPRAAWGVTADEARLLGTFPPKWEVGRSWVVEVEEGSAIRRVTIDRECQVKLPFYRYRVKKGEGDLVVLSVQREGGHVEFKVRLDPFQVVEFPHSLRTHGDQPFETEWEYPYKRWVPREIQGCVLNNREWQLPSAIPFVIGGHESVGARMGPRTIFGVRQELAFRSDGLLEVRLRSIADVERGRTRIQVWRKGDPWWAKVECDQPPVTGEGDDQMFRARLIAVDEKPVEVLPWELPPEKWLLIPRRCRGEEHFTEPDPTPPFERYKWEWRDMREPDDMRPSWQR